MRETPLPLPPPPVGIFSCGRCRRRRRRRKRELLVLEVSPCGACLKAFADSPVGVFYGFDADGTRVVRGRVFHVSMIFKPSKRERPSITILATLRGVWLA